MIEALPTAGALLLTSLSRVEQLEVVLHDPVHERPPADPRGRHEHEGLAGEGRHPLHRLVQLQVRRVHLRVLLEGVAEPLLLLLLQETEVRRGGGEAVIQWMELELEVSEGASELGWG